MTNFSDFGLSKGTFDTLPSDDTWQHWAGMPEVKEKLTDIIASVRSDDIGQSEFVVMCGAWGGGKTHAMRYFEQQINKDGDCYAFYASEVRRGDKNYFLSIYKQIVEENKRELLKLARHVKSAVSKESGNEDATDFLKIIDDRSSDVHIAELRSKLFDLSGSSSGDDVVSILVDKQKVNDDYTAANMLATLIAVMTSCIGSQPAMYKAVYIFLDELEGALELKPAVLFSFFAALRQLINATVNKHCGILLAFSRAAAILEQQLDEALWERMTRKLWEFEHLDTDSAKQFVLDYLKTRREEGASPPQPFFPFSEEAITWILERGTQIVPRKILGDMKRVFQRATRNGEVKRDEGISLRMTEEILSKAD